MTLPEVLVIVVPALPALAAAASAIASPAGWSTPTTRVGERSYRWAVGAAAAAFVVAVVVAVIVAVDGPFGVVVEGSGGDALVGLHASRVTSVLGLLTTGVQVLAGVLLPSATVFLALRRWLGDAAWDWFLRSNFASPKRMSTATTSRISSWGPARAADRAWW